MIKTLAYFAKKELVLIISCTLAMLSAMVVPPSKDYYSYIDFSVIAILFSLMAIVAGFMKYGIFDALSYKILSRQNSSRIVAIIMVNVVFLSAMFVTNDVALITFVPVTIGIFRKNDQRMLISLIVMETIAANIGSMLTPIGNPQNLYLYSFYHMNMISFMKIVFPLGLVGYGVIMLVMLAFKNTTIYVDLDKPKITNKTLVFIYLMLFLLSMLSVLRLLDYRLSLACVVVVLTVLDRKIFQKIDYSLLITFLAFFIFVGNLSHMDTFRSQLTHFLSGKIFISSVLVSQVISNVPAAIMLSGFTENIKELLLGVNIGGLGSLVASLASLISFRIYGNSANAEKKRYFIVFTIYNLIILVILMTIAKLLFLD